MSENRRFHVIDLGKMINSNETLSLEFNRQISHRIRADRDVHFLQAVSHDGHVFVFLRELDPATKKVKP